MKAVICISAFCFNHILTENNDAGKMRAKGLERSQTATTTITSALGAYAISKIINQCGLHVFLRPSKAAGERMHGRWML